MWRPCGHLKSSLLTSDSILKYFKLFFHAPTMHKTSEQQHADDMRTPRQNSSFLLVAYLIESKLVEFRKRKVKLVSTLLQVLCCWWKTPKFSFVSRRRLLTEQ